MKSQKDYLTTLLLCIFLGPLGVHRFYTGKIGTGIAMIFTFGGALIWAMVDLIFIIAGRFKDSTGAYIMTDNQAVDGGYIISSPVKQQVVFNPQLNFYMNPNQNFQLTMQELDPNDPKYTQNFNPGFKTEDSYSQFSGNQNSKGMN